MFLFFKGKVPLKPRPNQNYTRTHQLKNAVLQVIVRKTQTEVEEVVVFGKLVKFTLKYLVIHSL